MHIVSERARDLARPPKEEESCRVEVDTMGCGRMDMVKTHCGTPYDLPRTARVPASLFRPKKGLRRPQTEIFDDSITTLHAIRLFVHITSRPFVRLKRAWPKSCLDRCRTLKIALMRCRRSQCGGGQAPTNHHDVASDVIFGQHHALPLARQIPTLSHKTSHPPSPRLACCRNVFTQYGSARPSLPPLPRKLALRHRDHCTAMDPLNEASANSVASNPANPKVANDGTGRALHSCRLAVTDLL